MTGGVVYQPASFGVPATVAVIVGAVRSSLSVMVVVAVLPAPSTAVPDTRWAALSSPVWTSAGQVATVPLSSAQVKRTVTGARNHPLTAGRDNVAVIVGGVRSEPVPTTVVVVVSVVAGSAGVVAAPPDGEGTIV